ncbi:MAG: tol-pal system YbgF family protein [Sandaracinaceae bacterium]
MTRVFTVGLLLAAFTSTAAAQNEDARTRARSIAASATEQYNLGDFEAALAGYSEAYAVFAAPQLLFNIGQCHREMDHHERVLFFFVRYLEELPDAANAAIVREHIEQARAAQAAEEQAAAAEAERQERQQQREAAQEAERLAAGAAAAEAAAQQARADAMEAEAEAARLNLARQEEPPVYEQWWFWTVIGVAVVAAGLGIGLGIGLSPDAQLPMGSLGTLDAR